MTSSTAIIIHFVVWFVLSVVLSALDKAGLVDIVDTLLRRGYDADIGSAVFLITVCSFIWEIWLIWLAALVPMMLFGVILYLVDFLANCLKVILDAIWSKS